MNRNELINDLRDNLHLLAFTPELLNALEIIIEAQESLKSRIESLEGLLKEKI